MTSVRGERELLLSSIRDLDQEHAAGELSDEDYANLRRDYVARAAVALRAEGHDDSAAPAVTGRSGDTVGRLRRFLGTRTARRWLGAGLALCFAGIATVLALALAGVRLPGEGVSGGVTLNEAQQVRQQLAEAQVLGAEGQMSGALALYQRVLAADPKQPEALTYRGYLLCLTAQATKSPSLIGVGRASIEEAISVDPRYPDAHFFEGLVLLQDYHEKTQALAQFRAALQDHVASALVRAERPTIEQLFVSLHQPVPASVASTT